MCAQLLFLSELGVCSKSQQSQWCAISRYDIFWHAIDGNSCFESGHDGRKSANSLVWQVRPSRTVDMIHFQAALTLSSMNKHFLKSSVEAMQNWIKAATNEQYFGSQDDDDLV